MSITKSLRANHFKEYLTQKLSTSVNEAMAQNKFYFKGGERNTKKIARDIMKQVSAVLIHRNKNT